MLDLRTMLGIAAGSLAFTLVLGLLVVRLGVMGASPTGTRKTYHVAVFTAAACVHLGWGSPGVLLYGGSGAVVVTYALARGKGFALYDALVRSGGRSGILIPFGATVAGGLAAALLFPAFAYAGYLAAGWGDAAGEIIGRRWGRLRYAVKLPVLGRFIRSVEGSLAVAAAAFAAVLLGLLAAGVSLHAALGGAAVIGLTASMAEALSGGGLDNLTLQVVGAGLATALLGGPQVPVV